MHEMLTILTNVHGVCLSVRLSVTRLKSVAARAVCGVIRCSLSQMPLASCSSLAAIIFTTPRLVHIK